MRYKLFIEENVIKTYEVIVESNKSFEEMHNVCDEIENNKKLSDAIAILDIAEMKIKEINQEHINHIAIKVPEIDELEVVNNEFC